MIYQQKLLYRMKKPRLTFKIFRKKNHRAISSYTFPQRRLRIDIIVSSIGVSIRHNLISRYKRVFQRIPIDKFDTIWKHRIVATSEDRKMSSNGIGILFHSSMHL